MLNYRYYGAFTAKLEPEEVVDGEETNDEFLSNEVTHEDEVAMSGLEEEEEMNCVYISKEEPSSKP